MNIVAAAPQLSPAVLHGSGIASIAASRGASMPASGGGAGASGGGSRSQQWPAAHRCGDGHPSESSHGAPSGSAEGR
jgi:hypothetical protein